MLINQCAPSSVHAHKLPPTHSLAPTLHILNPLLPNGVDILTPEAQVLIQMLKIMVQLQPHPTIKLVLKALFNCNSLMPILKSSPKLTVNTLNASTTFYQNLENKVPTKILRELSKKPTPKLNWPNSSNPTVSKF